MEKANKKEAIELTLEQYQKRAMSTCTASSDNFAYMAIGMVAEVGEICDKVAKAIRKQQAQIENNDITLLAKEPEDRAAWCDGLHKELGDVLWFCAGMASTLGWSLEDVARANLAKLADRQKRNMIIGDGDNR